MTSDDSALGRDFADRATAAGITPDDPGLETIRRVNAAALARAGVAPCECPHLSVDHHLTSRGERSWCQAIGPGGVRCGCPKYTPRAAA